MKLDYCFHFLFLILNDRVDGNDDVAVVIDDIVIIPFDILHI